MLLDVSSPEDPGALRRAPVRSTADDLVGAEPAVAGGRSEALGSGPVALPKLGVCAVLRAA